MNKNFMRKAREELWLTAYPDHFRSCFEELADECCGQTLSRYLRYNEDRHQLEAGEKVVELTPGRPETRCVEMRLVVDWCRSEIHGRLIPIVLFGRFVGVLEVQGPQPLPAETTTALENLGHEAALIESRLNEKLEYLSYSSEMLDLLVEAGETLEPQRQGQATQVSRLVAEMCAVLDFSPQTRSNLILASNYANIGRLRLQGRGADEIDRLHPSVGGELLRSSKTLAQVAPLVEAHHERYDGSGFPAGVQRDQFPLEHGVLALAEALVESRRAQADRDWTLWLEGFYRLEAPRHHPMAVDSLSSLVDSGRLQNSLS